MWFDRNYRWVSHLVISPKLVYNSGICSAYYLVTTIYLTWFMSFPLLFNYYFFNLQLAAWNFFLSFLFLLICKLYLLKKIKNYNNFFYTLQSKKGKVDKVSTNSMNYRFFILLCILELKSIYIYIYILIHS